MTDATEVTANPTMLYKPGETVNPEAWNRKLDTSVVDANDKDALAAAKAGGWVTVDELVKADAAAAARAKPGKA